MSTHGEAAVVFTEACVGPIQRCVLDVNTFAWVKLWSALQQGGLDMSNISCGSCDLFLADLATARVPMSTVRRALGTAGYGGLVPAFMRTCK